MKLWVIVVCSASFGNLKSTYSFSHTDIRVKEPTLESLCRSVSEVVVSTIQFHGSAIALTDYFSWFSLEYFQGKKAV